jgi:hypothetical protein
MRLKKEKFEAIEEERRLRDAEEKARQEAKMAKTARAIRAAKLKAKELREEAAQAELKRNRIRAARIEL